MLENQIVQFWSAKPTFVCVQYLHLYTLPPVGVGVHKFDSGIKFGI